MKLEDLPDEPIITPCFECRAFSFTEAFESRPDGQFVVHLSCGHTTDSSALKPPESYSAPEVNDG